VIVGNIADGVRLDGASTIGSRVAGNWIGRLRRGNLLVANGSAGVRLRNGANFNTVGDLLPVQLPGLVQFVRAPNQITANTIGVVVDGAATVSNRVLDNSINGHPGVGIDNVAGGNRELAPPVITSISGDRARGTADGVPDGSLVQVFCDPVNEGLRWIGEGRVTSEAFDVGIMNCAAPQNVNATVTHAATGDTSEFSVPVPGEEAALEVEVDPDVTPPATAAPGSTGIVVLPLRLRALNASIAVTSLAITASGSLNDAAGVTSAELRRDFDGDGVLSAADALLSGLATFSSDDGSLAFGLDAVIASGETERWLVVYALSGAAPAGATFAARVASPSAVVAELALGTGTPVTPQGLPAAGPTITVTGAPDRDGDGIPDASDNCPWFANPNQLDTAGTGRGNACRCGDQNGDGRVNVLDLIAINVAIFNPLQITALCDGNNDGLCNVNDIVAANVEVFSPGHTATCSRQPVPGP
jgi:hypothetical protein